VSFELAQEGVEIGGAHAVAVGLAVGALTYFAASKTGVVLVPLNYRLAPPEWGYILSDASPRLLIASAEYCAAIDALRAARVGRRIR
jgi:fatty-acyl-CoA synthase